MQKSNAQVYTETCDYCGAVYDVHVSELEGCNQSEEYYCPECGKEYKRRSSNSPHVHLKSPRTDGKTDKYENKS